MNTIFYHVILLVNTGDAYIAYINPKNHALKACIILMQCIHCVSLYLYKNNKLLIFNNINIGILFAL
jgi:hypothetical protein